LVTRWISQRLNNYDRDGFVDGQLSASSY